MNEAQKAILQLYMERCREQPRLIQYRQFAELAPTATRFQIDQKYVEMLDILRAERGDASAAAGAELRAFLNRYFRAGGLQYRENYRTYWRNKQRLDSQLAQHTEALRFGSRIHRMTLRRVRRSLFLEGQIPDATRMDGMVNQIRIQVEARIYRAFSI